MFDLQAQLGDPEGSDTTYQKAARIHAEGPAQDDEYGPYYDRVGEVALIAYRLSNAGRKDEAIALVDQFHKDDWQGKSSDDRFYRVRAFANLARIYHVLGKDEEVAKIFDTEAMREPYWICKIFSFGVCHDDLVWTYYIASFNESRDDKRLIEAAVRHGYFFRYHNWRLSSYPPFIESKWHLAEIRNRLFGAVSAKEARLYGAIYLCYYMDRCDAAANLLDQLSVYGGRLKHLNFWDTPIDQYLYLYAHLSVGAKVEGRLVSQDVTPADASYKVCLRKPSAACLVTQMTELLEPDYGSSDKVGSSWREYLDIAGYLKDLGFDEAAIAYADMAIQIESLGLEDRRNWNWFVVERTQCPGRHIDEYLPHDLKTRGFDRLANEVIWRQINSVHDELSVGHCSFEGEIKNEFERFGQEFQFYYPELVNWVMYTSEMLDVMHDLLEKAESELSEAPVESSDAAMDAYFSMARGYAYLGNRDKTILWADRAIDLCRETPEMDCSESLFFDYFNVVGQQALKQEDRITLETKIIETMFDQNASSDLIRRFLMVHFSQVYPDLLTMPFGINIREARSLI